VSEREIRTHAAAGRLTASDLVWRTGQPNWVSASSVPGLFAGPPPLPSTSHIQPKAAGNKKSLVLGIIGVALLLVVASLQSMMNNHNRRRQEEVDFHGNEARRSLERAEEMLDQVRRNQR